MSILSRFSDIISANVNDLLDRAENPSKMIDQSLRKATEQLAQVKEETAGIMAETKRCKRLYDEALDNVGKYETLARKAVAAGNDEDARVFLGQKQEAEASLARIKPAYDAAVNNEEKIKAMYNKLVSDINEMKARQQSIKATVAVAKAQERVNDFNGAANSVKGARATFDRMEERANAMLDRATSKAELDATPDKEISDLEKKYAGGSGLSVDDELAKLKAEMGNG